jgi:aryl-alcohol dehydrogenase-like predicted oxidoreductase
MLGTFAEQVSSVRPVTVQAAISYLKMARGKLTASARTVVPPEQLQSELANHGRATFDVAVNIANERGVTVAQLTAKWMVSTSKATS